jgi:glycosyltransferase involved in cell wall biosynthesis
MKILFLTYYFEPDLCAGSFRNTSLFKELVKKVPMGTTIEVITTFPNRYDSFEASAKAEESYAEGVTVHRIQLPKHGSGLKGQVIAFKHFYTSALQLVKGIEFDIVYASSSRLFTAFLGSRLARKNNAKLYLDIRDIFRESIIEIFNSKLLKIGLNVFLKPIENYTFGRANHINLVSKGFQSYFENYKQASFSYHTNGIDQVFIDQFQSKQSSQETDHKKTILYAGNMGEGQGLDKIIPQAALKLPEYKFILIGDGGTKPKLKEEVERLNLTNVELCEPVSRNELIEKYQEAGFLFLHLNDYKAFERVLPSKLFEYATFNKPIVAGVGGYAAQFIKEELPDTLLFEPTDVDGLQLVLKNFTGKVTDKSDFVNKFDRSMINQLMSQSIIDVYEN